MVLSVALLALVLLIGYIVTRGYGSEIGNRIGERGQSLSVDRGAHHELLQRRGPCRTPYEHQFDLEARPLVATAAGE